MVVESMVQSTQEWTEVFEYMIQDSSDYVKAGLKLAVTNVEEYDHFIERTTIDTFTFSIYCECAKWKRDREPISFEQFANAYVCDKRDALERLFLQPINRGDIKYANVYIVDDETLKRFYDQYIVNHGRIMFGCLRDCFGF